MTMLGNLAVSAFFMLSGYLTAMTRYRSVTDGTFRWFGFMKDKYLRLLPVYLVCLLLAMWSHDEFSRAGDMWYHFVLLQSWVLTDYYYFSGTGTGWFISSLLLCFAVFPLMVKVLEKARRYLWVPVAVVLLLYTLYVMRYTSWRDCAYIYVFPPARAIDFLWGVILWQITSAGRGAETVARMRRWPAWRINLAGSAVLVLAVVTCAFGDLTANYLREASLCWPAAWLLLAVCVIFDGRGGVIDRIMSWRALRAFGTVSFAFFLVHMIVHDWFDVRYEALYMPLPQLLCFCAVVFVTALALSVALNRLVERPAAAWLRPRHPAINND